MSNQQRKLEYHWGSLIAQSWADDSFKEVMLADPAAALRNSGFSVPADVELKVVEDVSGIEMMGNVIKLPLPAKPGAEEFSAEEIDFSKNSVEMRTSSNCTDKCNCGC